ncbi:inositol monophosphatase family protein [Jatrophihabitans sp. DSM 45814]
MTDDLTLAAELVRAAGLLAKRMLAEGLETKHKTSVSDVVSAADHAAEALIVTRLRAERPDDGLIGEEGTADSSSALGSRTWYIDPVDGTYNFLSGLPYWCSAIALAERERPEGPLVPILGAVYHPFADELWLGGHGHPTTCNGVPVAPLRDSPLSQLSVASYLHPATLPDDTSRQPLLAILGGAATVRMLGSGSVELAAVAGGRIGAWAQHDSLDWDWFPGVALVTAAGGITEVVEASGHRWHIAGNRQAVADVRQAILANRVTLGTA